MRAMLSNSPIIPSAINDRNAAARYLYLMTYLIRAMCREVFAMSGTLFVGSMSIVVIRSISINVIRSISITRLAVIARGGSSSRYVSSTRSASFTRIPSSRNDVRCDGKAGKGWYGHSKRWPSTIMCSIRNIPCRNENIFSHKVHGIARRFEYKTSNKTFGMLGRSESGGLKPLLRQTSRCVRSSSFENIVECR